jgi:holo-[acyl-carrier protein] synthase
LKIFGHGVDLVEISRIQEILEKKESGFEARVFSEEERRYCRAKKNPYPHFAARFAAKEAYGKALRLGLGPSGNFVEIEVVCGAEGAPEIRLHGRAKEIFAEMGGSSIFLSLSHEGGLALASVIVSS